MKRGFATWKLTYSSMVASAHMRPSQTSDSFLLWFSKGLNPIPLFSKRFPNTHYIIKWKHSRWWPWGYGKGIQRLDKSGFSTKSKPRLKTNIAVVYKCNKSVKKQREENSSLSRSTTFHGTWTVHCYPYANNHEPVCRYQMNPVLEGSSNWCRKKFPCWVRSWTQLHDTVVLDQRMEIYDPGIHLQTCLAFWGSVKNSGEFRVMDDVFQKTECKKERPWKCRNEVLGDCRHREAVAYACESLCTYSHNHNLLVQRFLFTLNI